MEASILKLTIFCYFCSWGSLSSLQTLSKERHRHNFCFHGLSLQLTALLAEVGLNIREAHAFSTVDGYSLDVFVVDGWQYEVLTTYSWIHDTLFAFELIQNLCKWYRRCTNHSVLPYSNTIYEHFQETVQLRAALVKQALKIEVIFHIFADLRSFYIWYRFLKLPEKMVGTLFTIDKQYRFWFTSHSREMIVRVSNCHRLFRDTR